LKALEKIYLDEELRQKLKEKSLERANFFDIDNIIPQREKILN
jgi:hypothetical protein